MTSKPRKTLNELASEGTADPWACPRCGCKGPHRVDSTYAVAGGIRRRRVCRNCGQGLFHTTEVIAPKGASVRVVSPDDDELDRPRLCA